MGADGGADGTDIAHRCNASVRVGVLSMIRSILCLRNGFGHRAAVGVGEGVGCAADRDRHRHQPGRCENGMPVGRASAHASGARAGEPDSCSGDADVGYSRRTHSMRLRRNSFGVRPDPFGVGLVQVDLHLHLGDCLWRAASPGTRTSASADKTCSAWQQARRWNRGEGRPAVVNPTPSRHTGTSPLPIGTPLIERCVSMISAAALLFAHLVVGHRASLSVR